MGNYDGIILDIDGTIWNTTGIVSVAWNKAIKMSGFDAKKVNAEILQKEFGKTMEEIGLDLWPNLTQSERERLLSECCTEEQIALKENTLDITYPGVVETVKSLYPAENFFIVSNCQDGYIELTLEKTGLKDYVKDFECFGKTGKGKAENIQIICSRNGLQSPVYIGDTQGDSDACLQSGIPFVWASYGFGTSNHYIEKISRFSEIKRIIGLV